jgi:uncharacterized protein involved in cysteine biosynthesis
VSEDEVQIVAPSAEVRPGRVRRVAAGAWHLPAGLLCLVRHARLWPAAAFPTLLGALLFLGGLFLGIFALGAVERALAPTPGRVPAWLALATTLGLWTTTVLMGLLIALALTLLISAPLLDRLARRRGSMSAEPAERSARLRWDLSECFRGPLWFVAFLPLIALVGLLPVVGPLVAFVVAGAVLGRQTLEAALARLGYAVDVRRAWHREWRWESLGFGLAGLVTLVVFGLDFFLAPALALGAQRLVAEIEQPAAD